MSGIIKRDLSKPLTPEESFANGHLTHAAMVSIAILTFITFCGNFTQLQLSAALPTIVAEFGISVTTGQWLTSIFQLVMGVMVPLTAYLTRRFSTRQIVITSMSVFTIGSLMAWVSPTFILVLLGRMLEAIGTGVMWPVLQITVFSIYPLSRRGGWQTDANGWRSIFLTLTAIGAFALVLATFWLHNFGATDKTVKADFFSVFLSVFGFGGLMFGFTNIENYPFVHPLVWLPMVVGMVGIVWFILRQLSNKRAWVEAQSRSAAENAPAGAESAADPAANAVDAHEGILHGHLRFHRWHRTTGREPLLDLEVLKNRSFTVGTITAALSFFAFSSITVILPLYIQDDRGFSATWIWWVSIWQFIRQIGMGFVLMPITTWSLNCLSPKEVSAGSAVTNTVRQIAGAIGAPVLVILMETFAAMRQTALGGGADVAIAASVFGVQWALRVSAVICFGMVLMVFFGVKGNGAGSTHDLVQRALRRLHTVVEH